MTELPKEWQQEAEKEYKSGQPFGLETFKRNAYKDGATAYKQAVEALLKVKIEQAKVWQEWNDIPVLDLLLEDLQTLKPTSND
jgi:hypothetical protein